MLWGNSNNTDFSFEIVEIAPEALSSLQLQRWLIKKEREIYNVLKAKGMALNEAEPEIVPTKSAVNEFKKEVDLNDKKISEYRRSIKNEIGSIEKKLMPRRNLLSNLMNKHSEKTELIRNSTGWRRLFHDRPTGFDAVAETRKLRALESQIQVLYDDVKKDEEEMRKLKGEYRRLYHQFSKVAATNDYCVFGELLGEYCVSAVNSRFKT